MRETGWKDRRPEDLVSGLGNFETVSRCVSPLSGLLDYLQI